MWLNFTNLNRWQPRQQNAVKPSIPQPGNAPVAIIKHLSPQLHTHSVQGKASRADMPRKSRKRGDAWMADCCRELAVLIMIESREPPDHNGALQYEYSINIVKTVVWLETFMEGLVGEGKLFKHYSTNRIHMNSSWCIPCVHSCMHIWHFVSGLFQCGFTPDVLGIPLTFFAWCVWFCFKMF